RKIEKLTDAQAPEVTQALLRATRIIDDVARNDGYSGEVLKVIRNLIDELEYRLRRERYTSYVMDQGHDEELLTFAAHHLHAAFRDAPSKIGELVDRLRRVDTTTNPFRDNRWKELSSALSTPVDQLDC